MNLFRNISSAWTLAKSGYTLSDVARAFLRGDTASPTGAQLSNAYQQSVWVYACVNALGTNVAQIPFRFSQGQRRGENVLESGPLVELFEQPNPDLDRFQFWELLVSWLALRGRVFIVALDKSGNVLPIRRRTAKPAQLLILNPDRVSKVMMGGHLAGWNYSPSSTDPLVAQMLLPEEVINFRLPNPWDPLDGLAPLQLALLAAGTDYASAQFMKGLMMNNADTGVIITTDQQPTAEQRAAIMAALKERKRAAGTADRPLFLFGGAKLEKPTLNNVDLQFLENRKFNRQEICAVFGVPQEALGFTEDANYAVMDGARLNFIENKILPLGERIEAALAPVIRAFGQNLYGWFDAESLPIMQKARRDRFTSAKLGFDMGVNLEQLNGIFDLGLSPELPHWHKSYLPFSLQEVGVEADSATELPPPPEDPTDKLLRGLQKMGRRAHQCAGSADYVASIAGSIKIKENKLSRFFFGQRMRVLADLHKLQKTATRSFDDIFNGPAEDAELIKTIKPTLIADLEFGGAQVWSELSLDGFKLPPQLAIDYLAKRQNLLLEVNQTTFTALQDTLKDGLTAGDTFEQLTDRVKAVFQDATDRRAETIAITETNTAVNSGRMEGMREAKVERKSWLTSHLENTRASHWAAEQQGPIPIDQAFSNGLMHPGDPGAPAGEVINCRCHLIAEPGDGKTVRRPLLKFAEFMSTKPGGGM